MSEAFEDSIALVRRAKAGDTSAWQALCDRYYDDWLGRLRAAGPRTAPGIYETRDAVQSAIASALARLRELRDDRTFFAWVGAIARRKMAQRRREERRGQPSRLAERARRIERAGAPEGDEADADGEGSGVSEAAYGRLLDATVRTTDHVLRIADLDSDGRSELLVGTDSNGRDEKSVWVIEDPFTATSKRTRLPDAGRASDVLAVFAADFDGDGRVEVGAATSVWAGLDLRFWRHDRASASYLGPLRLGPVGAIEEALALELDGRPPVPSPFGSVPAACGEDPTSAA